MSYTLVDVIPFDLGREITPNLLAASFTSSWEDRADNRRRRTLIGDTVFSGFRRFSDDTVADCDIFADGVGVFTLHIDKNVDSLANNVAEQLLIDRRRDHLDKLEGRDPVLQELSRLVDVLRSSLTTAHTRKSASPLWEYGGYSYIFSIYHFSDGPSPLTDPSVLYSLLEPSVVGIEDTPLMDDMTIDISPVGDSLVEEYSVDLRTAVHGYVSWSNVIVIGDSRARDDYICLEVRLQHWWFYIYTLKSQAKEALSSNSATIDIHSLEEIQLSLSLALVEVKSINDSSLPRRDRAILERMVDTSEITKELGDAKQILDILQFRENRKVQERRSQHQSVATILLAVIAVLQAYQPLRSITGFMTSAISTIASALILVGALGVLVYVVVRN